MTKIIACVDGSKKSENVCDLTVWVNKNTNLDISLLHVAIPHNGVEAKSNLSGSIGLGSDSNLLQELSELDEEHGKMELEKGLKILEDANKSLAKNNVKKVEILHRRGDLEETILDLQDKAELIILGKNGEGANDDSSELGSNLEDVARSVSKPILVATKQSKNIKNFLIAYDGSANSKKLIEYISQNKLLKNLECHILNVGNNNLGQEVNLQDAKNKLTKSGFKVNAVLKEGTSVVDEIMDYIDKNKINLLVIDAYKHSKIRSFILGSKTTSIIKKSEIPVLLFR